jgi:hypothetical protein
MRSLLKNPLSKGGMPAMASVPMRKVMYVIFDAATQAAHLADVLFAAQGMDHAAGAQEEQGLEEGMRGDVEHRRAIGPHAQGGEHVAQLAHGGIGQHLLDVVLEQADAGGEQRGGHPVQARRPAVIGCQLDRARNCAPPGRCPP